MGSRAPTGKGGNRSRALAAPSNADASSAAADGSLAVGLDLTLEPKNSGRLQREIAETLGVPEHLFHGQQTTPNAVSAAHDLGISDEVVFSLECMELFDAYMSIEDPEERRRCRAYVLNVSRESSSSS
ncbi:hypothetical protein [Methylorubrum populi]|uniref:hypothetical protein n=1 Tax=Methylorubrum populi TaxID=223967 RepID=UPI002F353ED7